MSPRPSIFRDAAILFGQAIASKKLAGRSGHGGAKSVSYLQMSEAQLAALVGFAFEMGAEAGVRRGAIDVHLTLRNVMGLLEAGHDDAAQVEVMMLLEDGYETFAGAHGWMKSKVDPRLIVHASRPEVYANWKECCEGQEIEVRP